MISVRRRLPPALLLALTALLLIPARADKIRLRNGRSIDGIVREETATQVIVDLGVGSMTISRQSIASIERSDAAATARMKGEWERKNFLHKQYVPQGMEPLAAGLRSLAARRDEAVAAQQSLAANDDREKKMQQQYVDLQNALLLASRRLAATPPSRNVEEYNRLVAENNALHARLGLLVTDIEKGRESRKNADSTLSVYMGDLSSYSATFWPRHEDGRLLAADDKNRQFLELAGGLLRQFESEFTSMQVKGTVSGGNTIVPVVINGKAAGKFIVDTGAAMTTFSEALAGRLGIDLRSAPTRELTLADGKSVTAQIVSLDSVQLGEARLEHVMAAVLPSPPGDDVDGLLGMNFLRHFAFSMQGSTGEITLKRFVPR